MFRKRAQNLSLNVIIVAAIALLVLVIVSVIFMARMGIFTKSSNDCTKQNGVCMDRVCDDGYTMHPSAVCYGSDNKQDPYMVCCVELNI
ncbi:hypothetical protein JXB31_02485 [Candidatus Woesearchaeota archaeon]|nr:hypothetical protein [Candidatus Woesearchaeota archaeon]